MGRPTTKPRLPALDPEREAMRFVRKVLELQRSVSALFAPLASFPAEVTDVQLRRTALYRDVLALAEYAVNNKSAGPFRGAEVLERLFPLLQGPLLPPRDFGEVLQAIDPDDEVEPMKLLLAAARAREALRIGRMVTSSQLAILAGVTRRHVGAEIREGRLEAEIVGRRGTAGASLIRPEEARRWLNERTRAQN